MALEFFQLMQISINSEDELNPHIGSIHDGKKFDGKKFDEKKANLNVGLFVKHTLLLSECILKALKREKTLSQKYNVIAL